MINHCTKRFHYSITIWKYCTLASFFTISIYIVCILFLSFATSSAENCTSKVASYWQQGSFTNVERVETLVRECIDIDPQDHEAFYLLGVLSIQNNKFQDAMSHFSSAIKNNPHFLKAYVNRAELQIFLKKTEEGLKDYASAIALAPTDISIRFKRANVLMNNARFQDAIEDYSAIIERMPDLAEAYNARALAYGALHQKTEMCSDFSILCNLGFCMNLEKARARNDCQ